VKNALIEYIDGEFVIGSLEIAQKCEVEHRSLKYTIERNFADIKELGKKEPKTRTTFDISNVETPTQKKTKVGRPTQEYLLSEEQATFLILLLRGRYKKDKLCKITQFKKHLTKVFFAQRTILQQIITQKQNAEWLQARAEGKIERIECTNEIKDYTEYCSKLGSKNALKYYVLISKMENKALFHVELLTMEYPNLRDILDKRQLSNLKTADRIIAKALRDGMEKKMYYKDIFQMAKNRIESFAELIGKSPILEICDAT
jgi:phage regulator Rha-like protein